VGFVRGATALAVLGAGRVRGAIARRAFAREQAGRPPVEPGTFRVAVHFPDAPVNLYQLEQWYAPLRALAAELPVVVLARQATTARAVAAASGLPVVLGRSIGQVETLLAEHPVRVVLYVNQNVRNFSVLRYRDPAHVFVSHGESDKDYMASNQMKAYDRVFVAGDAARERLACLAEYDVAARTVPIGRPQVDAPPAGPVLPPSGRTTVLYAPTWEGDRPSMAYGSLVSHGDAIVDALLADPAVRLVVRPHPRSGTSDPATGAALRRLRGRVEAAARRQPEAGHLWDDATPFGWHLRACDACVTDISAVAYDWLATNKPLVLTRPISPDAIVETAGLGGRLPLLDAAEAGRVRDRLAEAAEPGAAAVRAALVERYYGDMTPGASLRRFLDAVRTLVVERDRRLTG
jgi:hypothetical protein